MSGPKKLPGIIVTIIFTGLLAFTIFAQQQKLFHVNIDASQRKEQALAQYGFYLEPVNKEAGINFRHEPPELDPKLKPIERQIASMGASVSIVDFDNDESRREYKHAQGAALSDATVALQNEYQQAFTTEMVATGNDPVKAHKNVMTLPKYAGLAEKLMPAKF